MLHIPHRKIVIIPYETKLKRNYDYHFNSAYIRYFHPLSQYVLPKGTIHYPTLFPLRGHSST